MIIVGILMIVMGIVGLVLAGVESMSSGPSSAGMYGIGGLAFIGIGIFISVWG